MMQCSPPKRVKFRATMVIKCSDRSDRAKEPSVKRFVSVYKTRLLLRASVSADSSRETCSGFREAMLATVDNSSMLNVEKRVESFPSNWDRTKVRELAEDGFYYAGPR